jgi:hypothetical protein
LGRAFSAVFLLDASSSIIIRFKASCKSSLLFAFRIINLASYLLVVRVVFDPLPVNDLEVTRSLFFNSLDFGFYSVTVFLATSFVCGGMYGTYTIFLL